LRAFSAASNCFKRSVASRGFMFRYPQRVRAAGVQGGVFHGSCRAALHLATSAAPCHAVRASHVPTSRRCASRIACGRLPQFHRPSLETLRRATQPTNPSQGDTKALSCGKATPKGFLSDRLKRRFVFFPVASRGLLANQLDRESDSACRAHRERAGVGLKQRGSCLGLGLKTRGRAFGRAGA